MPAGAFLGSLKVDLLPRGLKSYPESGHRITGNPEKLIKIDNQSLYGSYLLYASHYLLLFNMECIKGRLYKIYSKT